MPSKAKKDAKADQPKGPDTPDEDVTGSQFLNWADLGKSVPGREWARFGWVLAALLVFTLVVWSIMALFVLTRQIANLDMVMHLVLSFALMWGVSVIMALILMEAAPIWHIIVPTDQYRLVFNRGKQASRVIGPGPHYICPAQYTRRFRWDVPLKFDLMGSDLNPNRFPPIINKEGFLFILAGEVSFKFDPVAWSTVNPVAQLATRKDDFFIDEVRRSLFDRARQLIHPISLEQIWADGLEGIYQALQAFFDEKQTEGYLPLTWIVQLELPEPVVRAHEMYNRLQAMGQRPHADLWAQLIGIPTKGRWRVNLYGGKARAVGAQGQPAAVIAPRPLGPTPMQPPPDSGSYRLPAIQPQMRQSVPPAQAAPPDPAAAYFQQWQAGPAQSQQPAQPPPQPPQQPAQPPPVWHTYQPAQPPPVTPPQQAEWEGYTRPNQPLREWRTSSDVVDGQVIDEPPARHPTFRQDEPAPRKGQFGQAGQPPNDPPPPAGPPPPPSPRLPGKA